MHYLTKEEKRENVKKTYMHIGIQLKVILKKKLFCFILVIILICNSDAVLVLVFSIYMTKLFLKTCYYEVTCGQVWYPIL